MCCPVLIIVEERSNSTSISTEVTEVELEGESSDYSDFLEVPEGLIELPQTDNPFEGSQQVCAWAHVVLLDTKSSSLKFCCLQFLEVF